MNVKKILVAIVVIITLLYLFVDQSSPGLKQWFETSSTEPTNADDLSSQSNNITADASIKHAEQSESSTKTVNQLEPEIQRALESMLNTTSDDLVEVETENGVGVDLQNRFQTVPVATINADGEVEIRDYTNAPAQVDK